MDAGLQIQTDSNVSSSILGVKKIPKKKKKRKKKKIENKTKKEKKGGMDLYGRGGKYKLLGGWVGEWVEHGEEIS